MERNGNYQKKYRVVVYYYSKRGEKGVQKTRDYETRAVAERSKNSFRVELELGHNSNLVWAGNEHGLPKDNEHWAHFKNNTVEERQLKEMRKPEENISMRQSSKKEQERRILQGKPLVDPALDTPFVLSQCEDFANEIGALDHQLYMRGHILILSPNAIQNLLVLESNILGVKPR